MMLLLRCCQPPTHYPRLFRGRFTTLASSVETKKPSLLPRIALFSAFSLSLLGGAAVYKLQTDESSLFWLRDHFPRVLNALSPVLGLASEEIILVNNNTEEEEETTIELDQIVGDKVFVCLKFSSGRIAIEECPFHLTPSQLVSMRNESSDVVLDVSVLDSVRAQELMRMNADELKLALNYVGIPTVPENKNSMHALQVALELCRQLELDLLVRVRLAQNPYDVTTLQNALVELEARKRELKDLIKVAKSKQGLQSIFRRN